MVEDMFQLARRRLSIEKILLLGVGFFLSACPLVFTQEEGEVADFYEDKWTLEMTPLKIRMVTPRIGVGKGRTFWYMVYSLENKSGADRNFFLSISAKSDRKRGYSDLFLPSVEKAIERQEDRPLWGKADKFKLLKDKSLGERKFSYTRIKAGEKRLCVAVFNKFDPKAKNITIRVTGLSNDIEVISDPGGRTLLRERIRLIHLSRPGDEYEITNDSFKNLRMEWRKESTEVKFKDE
ncbi:MAG: hypothetical protein MK133_12380 [Planctomycetes bacterium]|nr:hypothetical protein [Planctomycetota bacterium]